MKMFSKDYIYIILGYTVLFILLFLSCVFYIERTCLFDVALQAFYIIETKNVAIQVHRFGAALIHIFPLTAVLLELPLKTVLISYSTAFIIENILLFFIIHKFLKLPKVALILALYNVLMVTETFYWTTSEIKQGISFSIFFAAVILCFPIERLKEYKQIINIIFQIGLVITLIFFHPLIVILLLFILGYCFLYKSAISKETFFYYTIVIVVIITLKYLFIPIPGYDKAKYSSGNNFLKYFPNYLSLESFSRMIGYFIKDWYLYVLMFCTVTGYYLYKKKYTQLLWVAGFSLAYTLLINITHPLGADKFYIESFYLVLGVFVLFPFVFEILPLVNTKALLLILILIFSLRINTIYHAHNPYTKRVEWLHIMLQKNEGKFVINQNDAPMSLLKTTWATAYETLLLSSLSSPDSTRTFIVLEDVDQFSQHKDQENIVYGAFNGVHVSDSLNQDYFRLKEGKYRLLKKSEIIID